MPESEETTLEYDHLPPVGPFYARAIAAFASGRASGQPIPSISARATAVESRAEHLARYRQVCGFARAGHLPATYPHVLAFPLHMAVLTDRRFPLRLLGLVHVRNRIIQHHPIPIATPLDLEVRVAGHREVAKGREFDLNTRATDDSGRLCWKETSVMLARARTAAARRPRRGDSRQADEGLAADAQVAWQVPADIGRRYAAVAGDYNPIHLSAWTARLFGFSRAIATGMWTAARVAAALEAEAPAAAFSFDLTFRKPVFLPSTVLFQRALRDDGADFALTSRAGDVVHLQGEYRRRG